MSGIGFCRIAVAILTREFSPAEIPVLETSFEVFIQHTNNHGRTSLFIPYYGSGLGIPWNLPRTISGCNESVRC